MQKKELFREEALEHSASPSNIDQLMQVVSPRKWLALAGLGTLVAAGLVWSIIGRIPITVAGQGVIVYPSKVVPFQISGNGQIKTINVRVGDQVTKGQVIATIDQSEQQKQLQLSRAKLAELEAQNQNAGSLQEQRSEQEIRSLEQQRRSLDQRLSNARVLVPTMKERLEKRQWLQAEGAVSADTVLEAQQQYLDSVNQVAELEAQLQELDAKKSSLTEQDFASSTNRQNQIQEVKREIAKLELQLQNSSQVISQHSGRVIELAAITGQTLGQGSQIGKLEAQESGQLTGVNFFTVGDGKKIQKGMKLQITPTTVKREEFGGIVGTVIEISAFPITREGAASLVGSSEVVEGLLSQGPQIQVFAKLEPEQTFSGYRWSSSQGPQLQLTSGTTTTVRVTIDERAPITFVLPILKNWSGFY